MVLFTRNYIRIKLNLDNDPNKISIMYHVQFKIK